MRLRDIFEKEFDSINDRAFSPGIRQDYVCPGCGHVISHNDINVANDIALCRNCGRTAAFSTLAGMSEISAVDIDKPPKHIRMGRDISGEMTIKFRKTPRILIFLIPFTLFWSGLSMAGIYGSQIVEREFDPALSLFGIPFLIGTIILVSTIILGLFGRWEISLGDGDGRVFVGVGRFGWMRRFEYNRDSTVSIKMTDVRVNEVPQKCVCVRTDGRDFVFGTGITDESKAYIAAVIHSVVNQKPQL